jgi:hypothetical protein
VDVPKIYGFNSEYDPFELMAFIFDKQYNSLGIEKGKVYIMPVIWGLCMEKAIKDEDQAQKDRVFNDRIAIVAGTILAPFTGGASLGLTLATIGVAEYDLVYQQTQQNQTLQEYQNDAKFRNAWNTVYSLVQIADAVVALPEAVTAMNAFFINVRNSKYLESAKSFIKEDFFNLVKSVVNGDGNSLYQSLSSLNKHIYNRLKLGGANIVQDGNIFKFNTHDGVEIARIQDNVFSVTMPKGYIRNPEEYLSLQYISNHIQKFQNEGAGFIVVKNWTEGSSFTKLPTRKFVGLRSEMDAIIERYKASENDWTILRDELNLGSDIDLSIEEIYYIKIDGNDSRFTFDIPNGNEGAPYPKAGAITGEWVPGGYTKNGTAEAVLIGSENIIHNNNITQLLNNFQGKWTKIK